MVNVGSSCDGEQHLRGILLCVLGSVGRTRGSELNDCCMLARRGSRGKPDLNIGFELHVLFNISPVYLSFLYYDFVKHSNFHYENNSGYLLID